MVRKKEINFSLHITFFIVQAMEEEEIRRQEGWEGEIRGGNHGEEEEEAQATEFISVMSAHSSSPELFYYMFLSLILSLISLCDWDFLVSISVYDHVYGDVYGY